MDGERDKKPQVLDDLRQKRLAYFNTTTGQNSPSESHIPYTPITRTTETQPTVQPILEHNKAEFDSIHEHGGKRIDSKFGKHTYISNGYDMQGPLSASNMDTIGQDRKGFLASGSHHINIKSETSELSNNVGDWKLNNTQILGTNENNIDKSQHKQKTTIGEGNVGASKGQIKTTAFYFSNPEATGDSSNGRLTTDKLKTTGIEPVDKNFANTITEPAFVSLQKQHVHDPVSVDGYDETVERLIRATKEELLGNEVKDNIWGKFRRHSDAGGDRSAISQGNTQGKGFRNEQVQKPISAEQEIKSDHNSAVQFNNHSLRFRKFSHDSILKPVSENMSNTDTAYIDKPTYTDADPVSTVARQQVRSPEKLSGKVDELFQSQQNHFIQQTRMNVNESQDMEPIPVCHESLDLSELGLSTHRPDSDRPSEDLAVDAKDINLGDTITEELRSALGESKFQEFLEKSKRDLDDLHERFSDMSTGRKEKYVTKYKAEINLERTRNANDRTIYNDKNKDFKDSMNSGEKQRKSSLEGRTSGQLLKRPQHTIPEGQDKDPTLNANGSNVAKADLHKQLKSNPAYKPKKQPSENSQFEHSQPEVKAPEPAQKLLPANRESAFSPTSPHPIVISKSDLGKPLTSNPAYKPKKQVVNTNIEHEMHRSVPEFVTLETNTESPRSKLGRPRQDPHNVYLERATNLRNGSHNKHERFEPDPSTSVINKNYEQVTVSRNVSFSADEIYYQAYGNEPSSVASSTDGIPSASSFISGIPTSPQTPVGYAHPAVSMMQYLSSSNIATTTTTSATITYSPHPPPSPVMYNPCPISPTATPESELLGNVNNVTTAVTMSRQTSIASDIAAVPHPPELRPPGASVTSANISSAYQQVMDTNGFAVNQFSAPFLEDHRARIPHPPAPQMKPPLETKPRLPPDYPGIPAEHPYPYSGAVIAPHPPTSQPAVTTSALQPVVILTDRSENNSEKVTIVEESTFTSVSQIETPKDVVIPHPPPMKKDRKQKSPRRPAKYDPDMNITATSDTKRHIDGVRQHHEQRRQEMDGERLTEEHIVEKQRKFAKASLDRYFSSLEQLYMSTKRPSLSEHTPTDNDLSPSTVQNVFPSESEIEDKENAYKNPNIPSAQAHVSAAEMNKNYYVDQDYQNAVRESNLTSELDEVNSENRVYCMDRFVTDTTELGGNTLAKKAPNLDHLNNEVIINDKTELAGQALRKLNSETVNYVKSDTPVTATAAITDNKGIGVVQSNDSDDETLVTAFTIKAGGITERLDELGIDTDLLKKTEKQASNAGEKVQKGSKKRQGKLLLVCPECKGFNKEYMSWCASCGEMLIGIEPVFVSKNRDGKLRIKPVEKNQTEHNTNTVTKTENEKTEFDIDKLLESEQSFSDVNDIQEKPFTLDLGSVTCKSPKKDGGIENMNTLSPLKSDGIDSGRPSSDDHDQELQVYRIEQEVVDDICDNITDPVVKGYIKSHFAKSHHLSSLSKQSLPSATKAPSVWKPDQSIIQNEEEKHEKPIIQKLDDKSEKSKMEEFNLENYALNEENLKHLTAHLNNSDSTVNAQVENELKQHLNESQKLMSELQSRKQTFDSQAKGKVSEPENELLDIISPFTPSHDIILDDPVLIPPPIPKFADNLTDSYSKPVLPQFSASEPVSKSELSLKLPANSLDFSQFGSMDYSNAESILKGDTNEVSDINKSGTADTDETKAAKRQARRNKRGHGAIDVEVFGYEESHECRNSSRGQRVVPILNLPLGSSDEEDMSLQSDTKEEQPQVQNATAIPPVTDKQEIIHKQESGSPTDNGSRSPVQASQGEGRDLARPAASNSDWERLFHPQLEDEDADLPDADQELEDDLDPNKPFLEHLIAQAGVKAKRPKSSKGKPLKSKVRQSIDTPGYQRKWARSSIAWSSFNRGELSTAASMTASTEGQGQSRNASRGREVTDNGNQSARSASQEKESQGRGKKTRPSSADLYRRKQQKQRPSTGHPRSRKSRHQYDATSDDEDVEMTRVVEHRLPRLGMLELLHDHMASPRSTYDKYLQMTPRIDSGQCSQWQCLPDEILLHIFAYLEQSDLTRCALVCQQFHRVAMDESLWKYITIKKHADLDDECLMEISRRHPVSLALLQCQGDKVTAKGLRDLFKECAETLKELNVSRCSRGALSGDSLLLHAAARCHNLTHVDTSWCHLTDSGLIAISNSCRRLESLCINGCQAVSNDGLETVIRQHGVNLRVLELCGCFNITPRGLRCVSNNCINLLSLSLGQCYKLTDSCIAQLSASLGRVETLDLRGCKQLKDNCIRRVVKNCTRLKHLSLANCANITDVSVLEISTYLTDIRSIDLCGCKNITDSSIRAMVNTCSNLRNVDISSTGCTHRSVSMIANFSSQRLETLKLNFLTDITEQSLIKLAKHCRRLKTVHLYGCTSVRNLDKIKDERPTFTIQM